MREERGRRKRRRGKEVGEEGGKGKEGRDRHSKEGRGERWHELKVHYLFKKRQLVGWSIASNGLKLPSLLLAVSFPRMGLCSTRSERANCVHALSRHEETNYSSGCT